jgi:hypothetical protein
MKNKTSFIILTIYIPLQNTEKNDETVIPKRLWNIILPYYFNFIIKLNFMLCFNCTNCFRILCFILLNNPNYFLFLFTGVNYYGIK